MHRLAVALRANVPRHVPRWSALPGLALALALLGAVPRLAVAQGVTLPGKLCYEAVDAYYATCDQYSMIGEIACEWVAGWGYVGCVIIDFIVLVAQSLPSPF